MNNTNEELNQNYIHENVSTAQSHYATKYDDV